MKAGRGAGGEGSDERALAFRRMLRCGTTDAERALWRRLRRDQLGTRFRRQHPCDAYVMDFYAPAVKLCVELDGGQHFAELGRSGDEARDACLASHGIRVLRFTYREAMLELDRVVEVIWQAVRQAR